MNMTSKYEKHRHRYYQYFRLILLVLILLLILIVILLRYILYNKKKYDIVLSDLNPLLLERQASMMLDNKQRLRLNNIINNDINRKDIEIVIARYKADISWSNMYKSIRTVYDKGWDNINITQLHDDNVIRLPNIGRESHTYLHHIVNNYDNLADITVFTQDGAPVSGSEAWKIGGGHLLSNFTFHDLVLNENGLFVFTNAMWLSSLDYMIRLGYSRGKITREQAQSMCPNPQWTKGGSTHYVMMERNPHINLLKYIASLCSKENIDYECSGIGFWNKFIKLPLPTHNITFFAQGSIFSVSKQDLLKRPKSDYEELLKYLSISKDPSGGYFMEWLWYYMATSNVNPCPVTGHEFIKSNKKYISSIDLRERTKG